MDHYKFVTSNYYYTLLRLKDRTTKTKPTLNLLKLNQSHYPKLTIQKQNSRLSTITLTIQDHK